MKNIKIGIAGGIASGKTTIAKELAEKYHLQYISFGNVLRNYCQRKHIIPSRKNLQHLGQDMITKYGEKGFMHWIIQNASAVSWEKGVILDGFRHQDVYQEFNQIFPNSILIFCDCSITTRIDRICYRDKISPVEAKKIIEHSSEQKVNNLKNYADFVYTQENSLQSLVEYINSKIQKSLKDTQKLSFLSHQIEK